MNLWSLVELAIGWPAERGPRCPRASPGSCPASTHCSLAPVSTGSAAVSPRILGLAFFNMSPTVIIFLIGI